MLEALVNALAEGTLVGWVLSISKCYSWVASGRTAKETLASSSLFRERSSLYRRYVGFCPSLRTSAHLQQFRNTLPMTQEKAVDTFLVGGSGVVSVLSSLAWDGESCGDSLEADMLQSSLVSGESRRARVSGFLTLGWAGASVNVGLGATAAFGCVGGALAAAVEGAVAALARGTSSFAKAGWGVAAGMGAGQLELRESSTLSLAGMVVGSRKAA